uniref:Uncharacterized protein n=1 Tax=Gallus gallus TaxID=9031 RepID=Q5ZIN5_CHICK|nr:hypothetical protein RCJMB04_24k22 [Gallus gallus]
MFLHPLNAGGSRSLPAPNRSHRGRNRRLVSPNQPARESWSSRCQ